MLLTDFVVCQNQPSKPTLSCYHMPLVEIPTALTSQTPQGCHSSDDAQSLPDFPLGQKASKLFEAQQRRARRKGGRRCRLEGCDKNLLTSMSRVFRQSGSRAPVLLQPSPAIPSDCLKVYAPMGSSRVQNQTTCVGFGMSGRQRSTERIARKPCVRGCATP